jgi:ribosomal protein L39E
MGKIQRSGKKKRLGAAAKQTRWAPFWIIMKSKGKGKKMHPSSITTTRRSWRRTRIRA